MNTTLIIIIIVETLIIAAGVLKMVTDYRAQRRIIDKAGQIVKGSLNVEDIRINGRENSSSVIANAFNSIKTNLLTFVESTKSNVVTLSDAVSVLSSSADNNRSSNERIAEDVMRATSKTSEQLELVKDNLEAIELNNDEMQKIEQDMADITLILDGTVDNSTNGLTNLEGYERDITAMSVDLSNINDTLKKFNDDIKKIEEVGDFIINISGKLRLLSLNASVETARAGEAGKGFAVVAKEVNNISVKTREGMDTINQIVRNIMQSSQQVNESIQNCEQTYDKSTDTFSTINESFRSINNRSREIQEKMSNISAKFDNMAKNSEVSKIKAESLFTTSQDISTSINEIASVSKDAAHESTKLSENTEALNSMMSGIEHLIGQFNTAITPVKQKPSRPLKIVTMSMLDNEFWYAVRRGALYAKKELAEKNTLLDYEPITGDTVARITRKAIDEKYDAIILPGFSIPESPVLLNEAVQRGIKVMTYNCDCSPSFKRVSCLMPDPLEPGLISAKAVEKYLNKKGNVVIIVGNLAVDSNVKRRESFIKYINSCKQIKLIDEISVSDQPEDVYKKTVALIQKRNNIDAIMITTGNPIAAAKAIEDMKKGGAIKLFTFDSNQEIFSYISKGIIGTTVSQDAFGQGHDPAIWMYNNIVANVPFPDDFIPCKLSIIDDTNVENLIG